MSKQYIIRLDDACEKRDIEKWNRMEKLLDKYEIKPIVGVIPLCQDPDMAEYPVDEYFWERAREWQDKDWIMALHGYTHVFCSEEGGLNPVNNYSEFAGVSLEIQKEKIQQGVKILTDHGIVPRLFFAPAHTFDQNTLEALKTCSDIRIISDTIANDIYCGPGGLTYIPQQSGRVRNLPFKVCTFCYHPNIMTENDFEVLEAFLKKNRKFFSLIKLDESTRKLSVYDRFLRKLYYSRR